MEKGTTKLVYDPSDDRKKEKEARKHHVNAESAEPAETGQVKENETPKIVQPETEQPKVEQPKTEQPITAQPETVQPEAETAKAETAKAKKTRTKKPKAEKPKVEKPKVEPPSKLLDERVIGQMKLLIANGVEITSTLLRDKLGLDRESGRDQIRKSMKRLEQEGKVIVAEKKVAGEQKRYVYSLKV